MPRFAWLRRHANVVLAALTMGAACTLATSTPASSVPTAQIAPQIWKFSNAHAAQSGVATVHDEDSGAVVGAVNRQCGPHASSSATGTAADKAVCTDVLVWNAGSVTGLQIVLVGAVPKADGKTKYVEAITGGANGYEGAVGMASMTPISASEYTVVFTAQGRG
ncbi:hypothetical protein [Streptomyces sp. NPDC051173]|uniref:hypothetical protein n=1 Tax=Streptomyces sp. NPDC051173 TaxID=3155164 RepID=UPI00344C7940